ncbi:restriction endonuclease subunit S [Nocardia zapadnayensis]|nr:restriction endonuclease subunit S [Nocardia zapadnayensis]MCX0277581.1 restriction endonuclease subunit S [Nocardia zapadnayensis]
MSLELDKSAWKRVTLGEVAATSKEKVDPYDGTVDRFVAGEHMDTDDLKIHRWGDSGQVDLGPAFHRRFRPGQVLYGSRRTYLRKVAVAEFGGVCANTTFVVQSKDPGVLLQEFLPFVMTSEPFHAFAIAESKGSVNPYVNWSDIARYEFDLPPLEEQARIADLLWVIERHRRSLATSLQAARELSRRLRADLFEGAQCDARADEMFEITIGRQRSPKHEAGDHLVPYVRSANVTPKGIDTADVKSMNFEPKEQQKFALRDGDVLVSEASASSPSVGMPAVWREDVPGTVCFQNTLLRYRAVEGRSLPAFVEQYCHWAFESGRFLATASGTNIRHIGVGGASAMKVPRTSISDQAAFISRTATAATAQQALEQEASTVGALLANLINHLLGGS